MIPVFPRPLLAAVALAALAARPAEAAVKLIGTAAIPGTATDNSGLTNLLEDGVTPNNQVGGLGSAITYTGSAGSRAATASTQPGQRPLRAGGLSARAGRAA